MKKRLLQGSVVLLALIFLTQMPIGSVGQENSSTGDEECPIIETFSERLPGEFDPYEYDLKKKELFNRVKSAQVPLTSDETVFVHVLEDEIEQIKSYNCEDCGGVVEYPGKLRVGIVKNVGIDVDFKGISMDSIQRAAKKHAKGLIRSTPDGGFVWEMAIKSPSATALRIHLNNFNLPKNSELYIYNDEGMAFGPYTFMGPRNRKDFWSHTVFGSIIYLQLRYDGPATNRILHAIHFLVKDIGHLTEKFKPALFQRPAQPSPSENNQLCGDHAWCVVDASCYHGNPVNTLKDAVALIEFISGAWIYQCSGGLLMDTDPITDIPYFITANHCIRRQKEADSLECFWQYKTVSCERPCYDPDGVVPQTLGADILSASRQSDYTFMELWENPLSDSIFLGWTTADVANANGTDLFRISHPQGSPQSYSEHSVDITAGTCRSWPRGKWIYSRNSLGATEPGSSGSPVVNGDIQIVGQLTGVCGYNIGDVCDSVSNATVDGAFANYYMEVAQWLDPGVSEGGTMHVQSIELSLKSKGRRNEGIAKVTIVDKNGKPVSGAEVTGIFSGVISCTETGTTNKNGVVTLKCGTEDAVSTFVFCVDAVNHSSYTYDSGVETCDTY